MEPLKINIGGIKCDNKDCDFKDMSVLFEDYDKWLNKPCPKCGSNLLTEQDYEATKTLVELTGAINESLPEVPDDEELVKVTVDFDGTGKVLFNVKKGDKRMNIYEFASQLNGIGYGDESWNENGEAKELGFVVVFGASDDLCELRGVIDDEVGCFEGGTIYLDGGKLLEECDDGNGCPHYQRAREQCKLINIIWHDEEGEPCWTYETDIPHATFEIVEDGEVYCRGIVFDIKSLGEETADKEKANKQLMRLLELIEIYNIAGVLKEEFEAFTGYDEPISTIEELIEQMEIEMSYWEPEGPDDET